MGNVGAFAEQAFALRGDPAAIGASAEIWTRFAGDAGSVAGELRGLAPTDFEGDEADTYRGRINSDLPPYLNTTSEAWTMVGGALRRYASTLADLQSQMGNLRSTGWTQWRSAAASDAAAWQAEADDKAHAADRHHQAATLEPGKSLPADTYRSVSDTARRSADIANAAYDNTLSAADQLRAQHLQAMNACADAIDRATAMRFADPPSWLGHLWERACDWVADHIDILQTLSAVLKQISSIAGTLAMIPILAPLAGPVAAGAGMLAFGIDAGIKVTTGQGNWTDIALTGMSFVPGAKAAMATDLLSTTNDAAHGNVDWTQVAAAAVVGQVGKGRPRPSTNEARSPEARSTKQPVSLQGQSSAPPEEHLELADSGTVDRDRPSVDAEDSTDAPAQPDWPPPEPVDHPLHARLVAKREKLPEDRQFLLDYDPQLPGVPKGWVPGVADNANGWTWQHPDSVGTDGRILRIMGPVAGRHPYPNGYARLSRADGEAIAANGKANQPLNQSHIPRDEDGSYAVPEGWNSVLD